MAGLADMITREFQRTGQPGKQTTTVTQPDEGFDPSNILNMIMMLLMSGVFKGKGQTGTTESLGATPMNFGNMSGAGSGFDIDTLMGMLPTK